MAPSDASFQRRRTASSAREQARDGRTRGAPPTWPRGENNASMDARWVQMRRRLLVPLTALLFFGSILYVFRDILLPFILALVVVFLMEPLVRRLAHVRLRKHHIPRWLAVLCVYLGFFSAVSLFSVLFLPPLTLEVSSAAEEIPQYFTELREKYLPRWSERLEQLLGVRVDVSASPELDQAVSASREQVYEALGKALEVQQIDEIPVVDRSGALPLLYIGSEAPRQRAAPAEATQSPEQRSLEARMAFGIVRAPDGNGSYFVLGDNDLRLVPLQDGSFVLRLEPRGQTTEQQSHFSLERELDRSLTGLIESGSDYAGDILAFLQSVLEFVINAFVMLVLMFMVAAFFSIDLPKIMRFVRSFVPEPSLDAYDELLTRLNRGLSGVIRGQLVICAINGTLTGIGLWALGVDFALMLGIIAGVLSLIPIFGTIISTVPAVLMGLVESPSTALGVLVLILAVHALDANFLTPKIVGSASQMHPVVIIFALMAGQSAFGLVGALLAVPVASIVQTIFVFLLSRARRASSPAEPSPLVLPDPPAEASEGTTSS